LPSGAAAPHGSTSVEEDSHDGGSTHGWSKELAVEKSKLGPPGLLSKADRVRYHQQSFPI
jgi:hypothetical protein